MRSLHGVRATFKLRRRTGGRNAWTVPGVLRLGEDEEPDSLNLMFAHTAAADAISGLLFSFLLRYDAQGNYVPDLATRGAEHGQRRHRRATARASSCTSAQGRRLGRRRAATAADWLFTYRAVTNARNDVKTRYGWDDIASASARPVHDRHPPEAARTSRCSAFSRWAARDIRRCPRICSQNSRTSIAPPSTSSRFRAGRTRSKRGITDRR